MLLNTPQIEIFPIDQLVIYNEIRFIYHTNKLLLCA